MKERLNKLISDNKRLQQKASLIYVAGIVSSLYISLFMAVSIFLFNSNMVFWGFFCLIISIIIICLLFHYAIKIHQEYQRIDKEFKKLRVDAKSTKENSV